MNQTEFVISPWNKYNIECSIFTFPTLLLEETDMSLAKCKCNAQLIIINLIK